MADTVISADPLAFSSSWSLGEGAYQAIVGDLKQRGAQTLVEFGSGTSTVRFSRDLDIDITSIEAEHQYYEQTQAQVAAHGRPQRVTVHHRPIVWQRHGLSWFRSFAVGSFPSNVDAVLIDGPPITTRRGREACVYQVFERARVGCRFYLDDYCRSSEQTIVNNWRRAYPDAIKLVTTFEVDHHVAVLEKVADRRAAKVHPINALDSLLQNARHFAP